MKVLLAVTLFLCAGITGFAQKAIMMQVKENTVPCEGVGPMNCMQVKEGAAKEWSNFYGTIKGFRCQPGYQYKLTVIKTRRTGHLPADAPAYTYRLKKVWYKKKIEMPDATYLNKKMQLIQINGKDITTDQVYMTLDNGSNHLSGKSGCNRFNASYRLVGNNINISPLKGTLMACDPENMELEEEFSAAIGKKRFKIDTGENVIHFKDPETKKPVLVFKIPDENEVWSFINGKKWSLIQMDHIGENYGNAMVQFDIKAKKLSGNNGCNNFSGTFTFKGAAINFSELSSTREACRNKDMADTGKKMLAYLSGASLRFDLAEQSLNFYKGEQLIMMFGLVKMKKLLSAN